MVIVDWRDQKQPGDNFFTNPQYQKAISDMFEVPKEKEAHLSNAIKYEIQVVNTIYSLLPQTFIYEVESKNFAETAAISEYQLGSTEFGSPLILIMVDDQFFAEAQMIVKLAMMQKKQYNSVLDQNIRVDWSNYTYEFFCYWR